MSLYISTNMPSSKLVNTAIDEAITFVAAHAAIERKHGRMPTGPSLDVTFMLPGEYEIPLFQGMRMGGYTHESDTLYFETAVPEHIIKSDEAPRYIAIVMEEVVENAREFFFENKIDFNARQWRTTIAKLTKSEQGSVLAH